MFAYARRRGASGDSKSAWRESGDSWRALLICHEARYDDARRALDEAEDTRALYALRCVATMALRED